MSNSQWDRIEGFLPGRQVWAGVTAKDNRNFVNGVLRVLRSGAQWKDLPTQFGKLEKRPQAFRLLGQVRNLAENIPGAYSRCC